MLNKKSYISNEEKFLYGFFIALLIGISFSSVLRFIKQDYFIAGLNVIIILCTFLIVHRYEKLKNYTFTVLSLFWMTSIGIFIYIVYFDYSVHIFLAILIPLAGAMLLNSKDFMRHGTAFILIFTAIMLYGYSHKTQYYYLNDSNFIIGFILLFFFVIFFSYVYHTSIKQSYTKLQKADYQKEVLLKEVHHRVKNNLNMMASILGLQEDSAKTEQMQDFIEQNRLRIKSIALVHELLYKESDFTSISLKTYIENLANYVLLITKSNAVVKHIDIEEISLNTDDIIHLGIIINELMTNSLKYAFTNNSGEISIVLQIIDNNYELHYKDNGKGIENTESTKDGFGLSLVNLSVEHLNGSMHTYTQNGLHTKITFKGTQR